MATSGSQDIEQATTSIQPDNKTRRYDRQLRLWAASGQAALESSRILVLSGSATSTSILKNLVLPGIGHFTILDDATVSGADAGVNFFLNGFHSIGKSRAEEAVPLLRELNDSVDGAAVVKSLDEVLSSEDGRAWVKSFSLVIAHNLPKGTLEKLSALLWEDLTDPPLIVVRSAGFLADFYIQFREQCIIESHSEAAPSLRLTKPFPALQEWANSLDYSKLDPTDHAHVPFVIILIKEADQWRAEHGGSLPKTYQEKQEFKKRIRNRQAKLDEENFEEAETQAWRMWSETPVPSDIKALFDLTPLEQPSTSSQQHQLNGSSSRPHQLNPEFHALIKTLQKFVNAPDGTGHLPLTSSLPDIRTDTESYVRLQKMYKEWSNVEAAKVKDLLRTTYPDMRIDDNMVNLFIKNVHHIKVLRGKKFGSWDENQENVAQSLQFAPLETATHLALNALSTLLARNPDPTSVTAEALTAEIQQVVGQSVQLPTEVENAVGEIARAPTSELPNTAAFLGGMVAQEAIKMITKQYVPVNGYCVVDLVDSKTGLLQN
ncbi:hypothetical protein K474DRAFT_1689972 [Panus rudis PR-1116 ss-1]|nr:hypothetical protein K474DRAFT_1689972 [Panus rudis PR-1116 ss-1]